MISNGLRNKKKSIMKWNNEINIIMNVHGKNTNQ
jgi:hypothetical protein